MFETVLNMALTIIMTRPKNQFLNGVSRISCYKSFLKFFANTPTAESSVTEVAVLRPATLLKKRLWHRCLPVNLMKFLRTPFLQNTSDIDISLLSRRCNDILRITVHGDETFNPCTNKIMLTAAINNIKNTQNFDQHLF